MQPDLGGPLDTAELNRMMEFLDAAQARGMQVIVDLHNYGRYEGDPIGSAEVPVSAFRDFWTRMADALEGHPAVGGYGLMNEPHDMGGADRWPRAAQAAVDGIRTVDTNETIIVAGDGWSAAWQWQKHNANLLIHDPADRIVYEAHQYFDRWNTGTYQGSYDQEGAYPTIGVDRLQPFLEWLEANNARGFIGEFGVPANDPRWLTVLDNFMAELARNDMPATMWGGGSWWSDSYMMALEPRNGVDRPQVDLLERYADGDAPVLPTPAPTPGTGSGDDALTGTAGAETLKGMGGNDVLEGRGGADTLDGGLGTDTASYAGSAGGVEVDLTHGTQSGADAAGDRLVAIENLAGSGHADKLKGNAAANTLTGGGGDDLLVGRGGADRLDGGAGSDTANYDGSGAGVDVDLQRATQVGGDAQGDTLAGIENLRGSGQADKLRGDAGANWIKGAGGNDVLEGRGGADTLEGGTGADRFVFASAGDIGGTGGRPGDRIVDFSGEDVIDLSAIDAATNATGNQAFTFIGEAGFSGRAGQLRFTVDDRADAAFVQGDLNGDRVADFSLRLVGVADLTANDFIL